MAHIALGKNAPAFQMLFQPHEIAGIESRALATGNGIAILLNTIIVSFCILAFYHVRQLAKSKSKSAFLILLISILFIQVAGYVSDKQFLYKNILFLNISSFILLLGFVLMYFGLIKVKK